MTEPDSIVVIGSPLELGRLATRRSFLRALGLGGSIVLLPSAFAACNDDDGTSPSQRAVSLDLRADAGLLNYAFVLEQLEAEFYRRVANDFPGAGITSTTEQAILTDIRNHEAIHRAFLVAALGSAKIRDLSFDFGTSLANRQSTLETARTFEDLGVAAYNALGKHLDDARNLLVVGKIASVEARHAAAIRDLLDTTGRAFAGDDVVDANGLDRAVEPAAAITQVDAFVRNPLSISNGPLF